MRMEPAPVSVAVLGASGTTGGELVRLLSAHPQVAVRFLGAGESAGKTLAQVHPHLSAAPLADVSLERIDPDVIAQRASVAMLALPHGASAAAAVPLLERGLSVVDLAGDFRLDAAAYPEWYGFEHPAPAWLDKAVYGLPELFRDAISGATLVANPGCYPTPVALGIAPLLAADLIEAAGILVDGKTGLWEPARR